MSHFTVAVITDGSASVDELLAPYDENIKVAPYVSKTKAQIIDDAKKFADKIRQTPEKYDLSYYQKYIDAETDEDFYKAGIYDGEKYDIYGNELSTYNPNSKWDWYEIGGRWEECFSEYGIDPNGTRIGDIKTLWDKSRYKRALRFWELYIDGEPPKTDEDKKIIDFVLYKKEYYEKIYKDKETYAKCVSGFSTFAVVAPSGMWYECGNMGWFGVSSETPEEKLDWEKNYAKRFIETANPDWVLTIVDCHI